MIAEISDEQRAARIDRLLAIEEIKDLRLAYSACFDSQDIEKLGSISIEESTVPG